MEPIDKHLSNHQLANVDKHTTVKRPPVEQVDSIADELVSEYNNPLYRAWYCGVINKYGASRVYEWHSRAKEGKYPGKLFTTYVNQAGGYRKGSN